MSELQNKQCKECGKAIVHPGRKYAVCLDCLIEKVGITTALLDKWS
jgi:hypothetical protein